MYELFLLLFFYILALSTFQRVFFINLLIPPLIKLLLIMNYDLNIIRVFIYVETCVLILGFYHMAIVVRGY